MNSFIGAATEARASEHINQSRDYIHLSHGHGSLHAGPRELLALPPPVLSPITSAHFDCVTYQAGWWGRATNLEGCRVRRQGRACLALRGPPTKWGRDVDALLWCRINPNFCIGTCLFESIAFARIRVPARRGNIYKYTCTHRQIFHVNGAVTKQNNEGTGSPRPFILRLVCFAHDVAQTWR